MARARAWKVIHNTSFQQMGSGTEASHGRSPIMINPKSSGVFSMGKSDWCLVGDAITMRFQVFYDRACTGALRFAMPFVEPRTIKYIQSGGAGERRCLPLRMQLYAQWQYT